MTEGGSNMITFPAVGLAQPGDLFKAAGPANSEEASASFTDLLKNAVDAVAETDAAAREDQMLLAAGESDDLHTLAIDMAKADLALQTLVQVRNKAIDAYKEIMQMPL